MFIRYEAKQGIEAKKRKLLLLIMIREGFIIRKYLIGMLTIFLLFASLPLAVVQASSLSTEEKYNFLVKQGIFTGYADGSSQLNSSMTREQFATVLFRLWELKKETTTPTYNDVLKTRWSYGEIQAVSKAGLMNGTGNDIFAPTSNVTIEQVAVVLVRAYGAAGSASKTVYGKVSAWAKPSVGIALNRGWINEQSDYQKNALRSQLVQAAYAVFIDMNPTENPERPKLDILSVNATSNYTVQIDLRTAISSVSTDLFGIETEKGKAVRVLHAMLSQDGKRVTITTEMQTDGGIYRLKVDGNTWVYRVALRDTVKPFITSSSIGLDAKIMLIFSEAVDKGSAENKSNYKFAKDLSISTITLASDNRTVLITTGKQTVSTVYTLTVKNVKDLAGNVMDSRSDLYFGSVVDNSLPVISNLTIGPNKIILSYNESLDRGNAEKRQNYVFDGGLGNPSRAVYNDSDKTVTLTTGEQTAGKVYTLTVNGITDRDGNAIVAGTKYSFVGENTKGVVPLTLQAISSISENETILNFNRSLAGVNLSELRFDILSDNSSSFSMSGLRYYTSTVQGDDRALRIQFARTDNTTTSIFKQGHVYEAMLTGLAGLKTSNNDNRKRFAGVDQSNSNPYVTKIVAVNSTAVTVYFNEPVKNVSFNSFLLTDDKDRSMRITSDQLNDKNKIVTQVTLNLDTALEAGKTYRMSFYSGITDAAGWNGMKTTDGSDAFRIAFQGSNLNNEAPRIKSVVAKDRYTFEIEFTEPVTEADQDVFQLYNETDRTNVNLAKGTYSSSTLSEDRLKVTVRMYPAATAALRSDKVYKLSYNADSGRITDLQGNPLDTSSGRGTVQFRGVDLDNARPFISSIEAWSNLLFITLSEDVTGTPTNAFDVFVNGNKIAQTAATQQGNIITLRLYGFDAGKQASVKLSALGAEIYQDLNKQKPITDNISFLIH